MKYETKNDRNYCKQQHEGTVRDSHSKIDNGGCHGSFDNTDDRLYTSVSGSIVQSGGSAIVFVIISSALDKIGFKKNVAKGI